MHETNTSFDWAPSLEAFVADLAVALEEQRDYRCFRPQVVDGRLDWDVLVEDG